jgi:membrane associated rhomboid family serine protease
MQRGLQRVQTLQRHTHLCCRGFGRATKQSFNGRDAPVVRKRAPAGSGGPRKNTEHADIPGLQTLVVRPGLFAGGVVFGSFALAAVATSIRGDQKRPSSSLLPSHIDIQECVLGSVVAANLAVFAGWQLSPGHPLLRKNFLHFPLSGRSLPLLLCCFSHASFAHIAVNMIAFWSFGGLVLSTLGTENFLAAFVSAGVVTSFASMCVSIGTQSHLPSLGASGAILAMAAFTAAAYPELKFSFIFMEPVCWVLGIPESSCAFPAQTMLGGIVALDLIGLLILRHRSPFDHTSHLAGALLGWGYVKFGG